MIAPTGLDADLLDPDALRSVQRLQSRGHEAYLVGGCVRDLLLDREPKDFDIATSARPQQVRRTFPRNCRIIGRRFKLAHLHFHGNQKILEVSTFRRRPDETGDDGDLLITQDNEFGTAAEDALRRDFTINALFLDPINDEILDHCGGIDDLKRGLIRTIGDPEVRFREDPVRILRAAKFAGRLGFDFDDDTFDAMAEVAPDLVRAAPPRVLEEILRLLRGGHSLDSFQVLARIGALATILPVIHEYLESSDRTERITFWRLLEALDCLVLNSDEEPPSGLLLAALFARPVRQRALADERRSTTTIAEELIQPFAQELRLPRRDTGCLKRICGVQSRFAPVGRRRYKVASFLRDPFFEEAFDLFALTCAATGQGEEALASWRALTERDANGGAAPRQVEPDDEDPAPEPRPRARRAKSPSRQKPARSKAPPRKQSKQAGKKAGKKKARRPSESRAAKPGPKQRSRTAKPKVETIEPEAIDVSAFDVELGPKHVPTFGTIVEGSQKKRRQRVAPEDDTYKPPPPPSPKSDDDVFGDW